MIKTNAFSAFIVCSILISGISNSYILGMDEEQSLINDEKEETAPKKSWRRICTWKNTTKGFVALVALCAAAFGGYEFSKNEPSAFQPYFPHNESMLICPIAVPINGKEFECFSEKTRSWQGVRMGEAVHSKKCLPVCKKQPDTEKYSFKKPKVFVCELNSPNLEPLLEKMKDDNIPYVLSGFTDVGEKAFPFYTYESANFTLPNQNFTVSEIENDADAMAVINGYFEHYKSYFDCNKFVLWKGE